MRDIGETWDVFVVGLRDSSHASTVMLAAELSNYTGMPTSEVELALMKGEVRVRAGLDRTAAESAALELDDIGAIIDLRLSDGNSGVFPILKPDAMRRSGVAVGGFIDDSATPPEVGDNSGLNRFPIEPDSEALSASPRRRPSMGNPVRTVEDIASEPIRIGGGGYPAAESDALLNAVAGLGRSGVDALGHVDEATGADADARSGGVRRPDSVPPLLSRASAAPAWVTEPPRQTQPAQHRPAAPPAGYVPRQPAPPVPSAGGYSYQQGHTGGHPAVGGYSPPVAAAPMAAPVPAPIPVPVAAPIPAPAPIPVPAPVPVPAPELPVEPSASASQSTSLMAGLDALQVSDLPSAPKRKKKKKKKAPAAVVAPDPSQRSGPKPEDSLELDFEAVGIAPKQRKLRELGGRISGEHKVVDAAPPRRSRAGNFAGSGGPASASLDDERGFLLGRDGYTAIPLGLAVGLIISLMVAIQLQRSADEAALQPLEEELRIATTSASLVDSGEVRSVSRVDSALEIEYDELKKSFVFKWLAIGLPLGFVLGRIPRST